MYCVLNSNSLFPVQCLLSREEYYLRASVPSCADARCRKHCNSPRWEEVDSGHRHRSRLASKLRRKREYFLDCQTLFRAVFLPRFSYSLPTNQSLLPFPSSLSLVSQPSASTSAIGLTLTFLCSASTVGPAPIIPQRQWTSTPEAKVTLRKLGVIPWEKTPIPLLVCASERLYRIWQVRRVYEVS